VAQRTNGTFIERPQNPRKDLVATKIKYLTNMTASPFRNRISMYNRRCLVTPSQTIDDSLMLKTSLPMKSQNALRKPIRSASQGSENREDYPSTDSTSNNKEIFRTMSWMEDESNDEVLNELWTLKRANPIQSESDDELEDEYASPSKRSCLSWEDRLEDDSFIVFQQLER
jgi:hypothetical protein